MPTWTITGNHNMSVVNQMWANISRVVPSINTSASGLIRRIIDVCGSFMDVIQLEILRSEQVITEGIKVARITTRQWYLDAAYNYQEGDDLVPIDASQQNLGYAEIDPTKQIIKQANTGINSVGSFYLNVATADENNNVVKLTQDQLDAFRVYYFNWLGFGAQVNIASNDPAEFTATRLYVRYFRTYNLENIKTAVDEALHNIQVGRRDDANLYINEVESTLGAIEGVRDAYFQDVQINYGGNSTFPEDGRVYLEPGYFNFDPEFYDYTAEEPSDDQNVVNYVKTTFEAV